MQEKTKAIVLHALKYSDSSTILTVYTREFGRVSYMVYGANKKKAVCRSSFFQALSIVELDVSHQAKKDIQRILDIRSLSPFRQIPFYPVKNAIALFLAELLFRTLRHDEADKHLFDFLEHSIRYFDTCEQGVPNFHLIFLLKLTVYLGCAPNIDEQQFSYFDLMNGVFLQQKPVHVHYLLPELSADLHRLLQLDFSTMQQCTFSRERRAELLESLVQYYRLHLPEFNGLQSLEVMQSLFD